MKGINQVPGGWEVAVCICEFCLAFIFSVLTTVHEINKIQKVKKKKKVNRKNSKKEKGKDRILKVILIRILDFAELGSRIPRTAGLENTGLIFYHPEKLGDGPRK